MIKILKDIAVLDRGAEESPRFVAIEGVDVNDDGHFVGGIDTGKILQDEAVRKGAVAIPHSRCIDANGHMNLIGNDKIQYFNGGYKAIINEDTERFLVDNGYAEPAE